MKKLNWGALLAGVFLSPTLAFAVVLSGSTEELGAFNPSVSTVIDLPASGILNYTSFTVPTGVSVYFKKNATNTPVVILASGNVIIAGNIYLNGGSGTAAGAAGDGVIGDDGIPGLAAAGGYDGGRGGVGTLTATVSGLGGAGQGPGGGSGGKFTTSYSLYSGGGGGGFSAAGAESYSINYCGAPCAGGTGGIAYGSSQLLPLIGGSGGGGGYGNFYSGSGGGGGGGAILIASNGTVTITGGIHANGGYGGASAGVNSGGTGGGGSGGAIRIVANKIEGNGPLNAIGGSAGSSATNTYFNGGAGAAGRIRLEADIYTRTASPLSSTPGQIFVAGLPTLSITNVGGATVPTQPTGKADVTLPSTTVNPVVVTFVTTGVPVGNTVKLTLRPANGTVVTAISPALVGDTISATASVSIALPDGPSTLQATVTYNIVLAMGEALSVYAQGEVVDKITLASTLGAKESTVTLITVSGKEYVIPAALLAAMPA